MTTITTVLAFSFVSACGVRLETAPPSELVPTQDEIARQALVNDFVLIERLAQESFSNESSQATQKALTQILQTNAERTSALGGVYDSGLPKPELVDQEATANPTQEGQLEATPLNTAIKLYESAARVRTSLDVAQDGNLARVTASVGIAHALEAQSLAKAAGEKISRPEALTATPWEADAPLLDDQQYMGLIRSEDFAGYAYEVSAAMSPRDARASLLNAAKTHRSQAAALATLAEVDGTAADPRLVAYELPFTLTPDTHIAQASEIKSFLREVESALATDYLDLIVNASATDRALLFDAALRSANFARLRGANAYDLFPFVDDAESISVLPAQAPAVTAS